ncbi:MAG: hypothetical protein H6742_04605 [Alphaproteobacteria bacterium]|nr:hypothetical protein [Alphaproteobacteria bacterium]
MTPRLNQGSVQENTASQRRQAAVTKQSKGILLAAVSTALATAGVVLWTGRAPWSAAVGSPLGEADNHLWMYARATRTLLGADAPWANLPDGVPIPLMDPVNLPLYLLGAAAGPQAGWNLAALLLVALSGLSAFALSRELGADRGAFVALVAGSAAPALAGVVDFGLTEAWGVGWLGLHAALLLRFGRDGRWPSALGAGLCLALAALQGWYQALFCLVVEPVLVLACLGRGGGRRIPGIVAQGLLALAATLPAFLGLRDAQALWSGRWHAPPVSPPPFRPDWTTLPIGGADLLTLFRPALETVAPSKAVYLGVVVLALCALGLVLRRRGVALLLLCAGLLLALALGPWPTSAGRPLGVPGPAMALLRLFPDLQGLSHWHRAVVAAVPFLAAAAGLGADGLLGRLRPGLQRVAVPALALLVLADGLLLSVTPWPRPSIPREVPDSLLALRDEAASLPPDASRGVVQLPFDNGRLPFSDEPARRYDRWQVLHGLPRSESYESVDALLDRSRLVAGWQEATGQRSTLPPEQRPRLRNAPVLDDADTVAIEVQRLQDWGYRWVVLHRDRTPTPDRAEEAVTAALGPPRVHGDDRVWRLP